MKKNRILTFASIPAAAVAIAAIVLSLGWFGADEEVPVVEVRRDNFARKVYAEGNLKAVTATPLTAPINVQEPLKIAWLAEDGTRVKEGDVVVRFDPTDMEKDLRDGNDDRSTAEHKTDKRQLEKDTMLDSLTRDADLAGQELSYAREFQSKDPTIYSRSEIIESQIDEDLATKRKEKAEGTREIQGELAKADLDLLEIEHRKAEIKIRQAEEGLNSLEIRAPHDGILVFQRHWNGELPKVGEQVWGGRSLAEIPNLDEMEAEVFVLEADGGGLEKGMGAKILLEARPDVSYGATIKKVDALAKPRLRWLPVQYFAVELSLAKTDPEVMKPGQRVRAVLTLDEIDDALVVPRQAVFEKDGKKIVYRRNGSDFDSVPVSLGPAALGRVVIEEGIEEGDVIALRDPTRSSGELPTNGNGGPGPTGLGGV